MYYGSKYYYQQIIIILIKHLIVLVLKLDWWLHLCDKYVISFKKSTFILYVYNVILMLEKIAFNSFPVSQVLIKNGQYKHNSKIIYVIMKITFVKVSL